MNTPIPAAAYPVVEILRRDVPRPTTLPDTFAGWHGQYLRWPLNAWQNCCPMGLHRKALHHTPMNRSEFPLCGDDAVRAYAKWFDGETDPQWVVDQTWGEVT